MRRRSVCSLLLSGASVAALAACGGAAQQSVGELGLPNLGKAPEITLTGWFNSEPITMASLEGKAAALVVFWTYT